ncbi:porin family protein [Psychroserpens sp. Hel_I_66]|uniref:porin family protein n=1 Tax=Psychroserpens sp. Hel_I_66 TaxID=1250004 RepID=UPI000647A8AD|nr:porin family protein [Psychroserpens sp. Hel_I_66]
MKKIIVITAATFMTLFSANAQSDSKALQLGAKGGVNFSNIDGDDIGDNKSRTSFNVGLVAEIPLTERISFQPELLYSGQGFDIQERDQDNAFDTDDNIEYQLDYIQVPLLFKAYLIKGLSVEAGPQFGFKINEEIDFQPTADGGDVDIDRDDSNVKNFDTSLALGSSYKFDGGFFVSARYTFGLTNIFDDNTVFENVDAKNKVWQFGIGFMF